MKEYFYNYIKFFLITFSVAVITFIIFIRFFNITPTFYYLIWLVVGSAIGSLFRIRKK